MTFREDKSRIRKKQGPFVFNFMRKIAMTLYKYLGRKRPSFNITQSFIACDKANEKLTKSLKTSVQESFDRATPYQHYPARGQAPQIYASLVKQDTTKSASMARKKKMAELALMSRSKFAELFKRIVGQSPGDYVIDWRIVVAKSLLQQNKSVSIVANAVGYENGSALASVFRKKLGMSPKKWLEKTL